MIVFISCFLWSSGAFPSFCNNRDVVSMAPVHTACHGCEDGPTPGAVNVRYGLMTKHLTGADEETTAASAAACRRGWEALKTTPLVRDF